MPLPVERCRKTRTNDHLDGQRRALPLSGRDLRGSVFCGWKLLAQVGISEISLLNGTGVLAGFPSRQEARPDCSTRRQRPGIM
jgi:hypothetical protein